MQNLGDMQHCFGGDTTNIETGAAEILLLNNCDLCAKLCGADGGDIATRPRANHCYVIVCACHNYSPVFRVLLYCCQYSTSKGDTCRGANYRACGQGHDGCVTGLTPPSHFCPITNLDYSSGDEIKKCNVRRIYKCRGY